MAYNICIDIGGTFTDCLVAGNDGKVRIFKSQSTPGRFEDGFINVLYVAAEGYSKKPRTFISSINQIVHGSTVATNALVEKKVARTGLLLNKGHKDILTLREGPRKGAFEWKLDYPEPYIPAGLTRTLQGRIDARGNEIIPIDEAEVREATQILIGRGIEAIAVGMLWSVANPAHEVRIGEIIYEIAPELPVSLSHQVNPLPREYKRIVSTAIDASLSPVISRYVGKLIGKLDKSGFSGDLLLANCVGGMMPTDDMIRRPIYSVMSGPTLAPMAALALTNEPDVIVGDMGGTTFDVSALRDHQLIITPDSMINNDALGIPKVDVRSVGAGGGSIARVDEGGLLQVGPQSAGARPGPACFDRSGDKPTVTDANLVLGLIDPEYFLGGKFALRRDLAETVIAPLAEQLGVSIPEAAYAIYTTSNHNMVGAIEDITIREGLNPRDSYFVCGGGGTALHIAEMSEILGLSRYMIPRYMAGLSAFGGLISNIRWDTSRALHTDTDRFKFEQVNKTLMELIAEADAFLNGACVDTANRSYELSFMGRYEYQSWEIEVAFDLPKGGIRKIHLPDLRERFHRMHKRIYSIRNSDDLVEFTRWNVRAVGRRDHQDNWKNFVLEVQTTPPEPKGIREVYVLDGLKGGYQALPVFELNELGAGAKVEGLAIIESETYTAFLLSGHSAEMDERGNLRVEVASNGGT